MKRVLKIGLAGSALLLLVAVVVTPVDAGVVRSDNFVADVLPDGMVVGTGSGWNGGEFVYYPESGWYNQWFYNDPPDPMRSKWITYDMIVTPGLIGDVGGVEIAINWSTMAYPENPGAPPLIDLAGDLIYRHHVYTGEITEPLCLSSADLEPNGMILIPDFNPEWVSIDIRILDDLYPVEPITITGCIEHQCVPEPSVLALLALGAIALVFARRSR